MQPLIAVSIAPLAEAAGQQASQPGCSAQMQSLCLPEHSRRRKVLQRPKPYNAGSARERLKSLSARGPGSLEAPEVSRRYGPLPKLVGCTQSFMQRQVAVAGIALPAVASPALLRPMVCAPVFHLQHIRRERCAPQALDDAAKGHTAVLASSASNAEGKARLGAELQRRHAGPN